MAKFFSGNLIPLHLTDKKRPFLKENGKIIAQFILTLFFIAIGIWFIKHEKAELFEVKRVLITARWKWVIAGILLTIFYIFLQGLMYVFSFASSRSRVSLYDSTILFIKRNLISVFLPAGGISSLVFFTAPIESKGIKNTKIHFASSIYGFIGILSVVMVAVPAFIYALVEGTVGSGEWYALAALILLKFVFFFIYKSIIKQGIFYKLLLKILPSTEVFMNDLQSNRIDKKNFVYTILVSVLIEFTGIAHLFVAMLALGYQPSLIAAIMGYIISVIFLIVSPFLRGLGAIEVSMTFVLIRFGFGNVEAIAVTFLYRFFEFWLPLLVGIITFISKVNKLLMRVFPALILMFLGIVNIISVLTPSVSERLASLRDFLPDFLIHASEYMVMVSGLFLLVTAAFMLKGLRSTWWFGLVLSFLSFVGHITKAIDWEESTAALLVMIILISTRKEYYVKTNPKLRMAGIRTALYLTGATLLYGVVGFYFLDKKHFNIDFNILQSIRYTVQNYFLVGSDELVPTGAFARDFLFSINISGFVSIAFLIYTLVRSHVRGKNISDEEFIEAKELMKSFGNSALDYFKTYSDKFIFFSSDRKAFVSYRISGIFAVALESPVATDTDSMKKCIIEFDKYCYESGLKCIYYRVAEEHLDIYHSLKKKELFLGQEGIVDITKFSLEGGSKKSMRNAINKIREQGFKTTIHTPPVKDGVLQKIKLVSNEWLQDTERTEIIFSQGMFVWEELKQQTIITVENPEEKIIAFLNIVPDFAKGEATYDLLRKTKDAPNGVMDFILVEMFNYLKSNGVNSVNLGFAPMSGIDDPHSFSERSMKFAYEKIRSFSHYKGLRDYKEKFEPVWTNKYLIYQHHFDLLKVPTVLINVIKP